MSRLGAMIRHRGPMLMRAGGGAISRDGRKTVITPEIRAHVCAARDSGKSVRAIAAEVGISPITVRKILRTELPVSKHGI